MANLERWVLDLDAWQSGRAHKLRGSMAVPDAGDSLCQPERTINQLRANLARTIETEIVPRLMLAHQPAGAGLACGRALGPPDVEELARLVVDHEADVALSFVATLRAQGVTLDAICLDLLSNTARYLGELWETDRCDFTDVTIGLWRLHGVLRELCPPARNEGLHGPARSCRILLSPLPGEQHSFGATIVCEFFRRAGWDVVAGPFVNASDLKDTVRRQWLDVLGLSISSEKQVEPLGVLVRMLRKASLNRAAKVLVGGRVFSDDPNLVGVVGADATAPDAERAVRVAEQLARSALAR